jgi:hypothetical protein
VDEVPLSGDGRETALGKGAFREAGVGSREREEMTVVRMMSVCMSAPEGARSANGLLP